MENVLLVSREAGSSYPFMKRMLDLVGAAFMIVCVLSWLLPLMALMIKLDSKGPVFFVQRRIGRNGRPFWCFKLRTMIVNDLADIKPASGDDARITRVGRWLRRTHLDELPQFLNVLGGTMSLVGPRPYMPADCAAFGELVADPFFRNRVKPGITGLAQSKGLHGPINDKQIVSLRYQWDAFYVDHADLRLDMLILRETITLMIVRKANGHFFYPNGLTLVLAAAICIN